jgi:hypothetical protein
VDQRAGRNEAVLDGHRAPRGAKTCKQLRPLEARLRFPRQTVKSRNAASNHRSSLARFFPLRNRRMPTRTSPRMMGSTAISRSFCRSHSTTLESGAGFVGSRRTLASTRYLTACRWTRTRWERRNPSRGTRGASRPPLYSAGPNAASAIAAIETLDLELLAGFDAVLLPELGRQHDLAFEETVVFMLGLYAVYPSTRNLSAKARVFIDLLIERFGDDPF